MTAIVSRDSFTSVASCAGWSKKKASKERPTPISSVDRSARPRSTIRTSVLLFNSLNTSETRGGRGGETSRRGSATGGGHSSSSRRSGAGGARRGSSSTQGGSARSASDTRSTRPARGTVPPRPAPPLPAPARAAPQRSLNSSVCEHQRAAHGAWGRGAPGGRGGGGGGGGSAPPARHHAARSTMATPAYERPTAMPAPSMLHESVAGSNTCRRVRTPQTVPSVSVERFGFVIFPCRPKSFE
ncbi:unnamed protein product [Arctia plantaginis]|uniref:Uncharacterized protein n=1 Tax=Arctia plantaginis TaxID=874455 RepID=A0A8S1B3D2_ARCPL|nr:unnamed protein product [Arctia plantaginis]